MDPVRSGYDRDRRNCCQVGRWSDAFLLAWEAANAYGHIALRRLTFTSACAGQSPGFGPVHFVSPALDFRPQLVWARDKFLLAWLDGDGVAYPPSLRTYGIDPGQYAGPLQRPGSAAGADSCAVASRWTAGDVASDEGLMVWSHLGSGGIRGHRVEATGTGSVVGLGGGCGITGLNDFATYSGSPVLGATFSIELAAPTAPVLGLVVGFSSSPFACGPCTIVPALDIALATAGPVPVLVPLDPSLAGASLYTQWVQWRPSGCALLPDFGFSNALQFMIRE